MITESEALLKAAREPMWYIVRKPHPAKDKSRTFLRDIVNINNIFSRGIENFKSSFRESLSHDERYPVDKSSLRFGFYNFWSFVKLEFLEIFLHLL